MTATLSSTREQPPPRLGSSPSNALGLKSSPASSTPLSYVSLPSPLLPFSLIPSFHSRRLVRRLLLPLHRLPHPVRPGRDRASPSLGHVHRPPRDALHRRRVHCPLRTALLHWRLLRVFPGLHLVRQHERRERHHSLDGNLPYGHKIPVGFESAGTGTGCDAL